MSDLILNGGVAGAIGLLLTLAFLFFIVRRKRLMTVPPTKSSSFSVTNPLRPQPPSGVPPKRSKKSYAQEANAINYSRGLKK